MARHFFAPIDLNKNELRSAVLHLLGTDPANPVEAQIWYNSTGHTPKVRLDGVTLDLGNPASLNGQNGAYYLNRANHTGFQTASTISDFDTQVRTNRLDQLAAPTAPVAYNNQKITGLADGTAASDGATYGQLTAAVQGMAWKTAVRAAASTNVSLAAPGATIGGVTLATGDRVLLYGQTAAAENGIYIWSASGAVLTRATDADTADELENASVFVNEGAAAGTAWNQTADTVTVGTTSLTWVQFGAGSSYSFGAPLSVSGNSVSLNFAGRLINNAGSLDLASGIATPGAYLQTTVDTYGRVTDGTNTVTTGTWQATPIGIAYGGLGLDLSVAANKLTARGTLNVPGLYTTLIGDGASLTYTITQGVHGLRSDQAMVVQLYDAANYNQIDADISINSTNGTVTLGFAPIAPTTNAIRVVIHG